MAVIFFVGKRLKNTIDPLLFYGGNFYGFSESDIVIFALSIRMRK